MPHLPFWKPLKQKRSFHHLDRLTQTNQFGSFLLNQVSLLSIQPQDLLRFGLEILKGGREQIDVRPYQTDFIICLKSEGLANKWVNQGMEVATSGAGGAMTFSGKGSYRNKNGIVEIESIHLISCSYPTLQAQMSALPHISEFLKIFKRETNQESVFLKLNEIALILY